MAEKKTSKKGGAGSTDKPIRVAVVPEPIEGDEETQSPENVENRNASYLPPREGVNQEEAE
jgi:hypothetical protein